MCLQTMKSLHEPVVVRLVGMEQEWPGTGSAGIGPMKYPITQREKYSNLCKIWTHYAEICRNMQEYMQKYASNMHLYAGSNAASMHLFVGSNAASM